MRGLLITICIAVCLWPAGCGGVPLEVQEAMRQQAEELEQIRTAHRAGVDVLFAQIRQLQLFILAEKERGLRGKYARGPRAVPVINLDIGVEINLHPNTAVAAVAKR